MSRPTVTCSASAAARPPAASEASGRWPRRPRTPPPPTARRSSAGPTPPRSRTPAPAPAPAPAPPYRPAAGPDRPGTPHRPTALPRPRPAAARRYAPVPGLDRPHRSVHRGDHLQPLHQLGDRRHPRRRRQRPVRRAHPHPCHTRPPSPYPCHLVGVLPPAPIMSSQTRSSQVNRAPTAISTPVSRRYSWIRV
jgi:hypothetical protein